MRKSCRSCKYYEDEDPYFWKVFLCNKTHTYRKMGQSWCVDWEAK